MENPFLLEGKKPWDKFRINFTILKSITISLAYISQLKKKILFFFALTYTLFMSHC